jgi:hypothetical protein
VLGISPQEVIPARRHPPINKLPKEKEKIDLFMIMQLQAIARGQLKRIQQNALEARTLLNLN